MTGSPRGTRGRPTKTQDGKAQEALDVRKG